MNGDKKHYLVQQLDGEKGLEYRVRPYEEPWIGTETYAHSEVEAIAQVARQELERAPAIPRTPREALLAINAECRDIHSETDPYELAHSCLRHVQDGLAPSAPDTFEWTDQLAGRLAEAHYLLTRVRETFTSEDILDDNSVENPLTGKFPMLDSEIDAALALPPDIEAAIDLRRPR